MQIYSSCCTSLDSVLFSSVDTRFCDQISILRANNNFCSLFDEVLLNSTKLNYN